MPKRSIFFSYFVVFLVLSLIIFLVSKTGILNPIGSFFQAIFSPLQAISYSSFSKISDISQNPQLKLLKLENQALTAKLIDQQKIIADNKALSDQFSAQNSRSSSLIPASVIGAPGFIPSISAPETITLDKGTKDGVRVGNGVIYQNNLIGKVIKTSDFLSSVILITNSNSSFTAKTLNTKSFGVVKGQGGGGMILDNVLLSDKLQKNDLILTKGDINAKGEGFSPDLVVGKITSVSKNPSDLFQKAEIKSLIDFTKIYKVFVINNSQ